MLKVCGRLKGLISRENLIFPQSRKSAKVRARPYFLDAYRPCSVKAIILTSFFNFPSRKAIILMPRRNIISTYRRHA
jgi:hypothetical protein